MMPVTAEGFKLKISKHRFQSFMHTCSPEAADGWVEPWQVLTPQLEVSGYRKVRKNP